MSAEEIRFAREVEGPRVVLLLGAFDPPTLAHLALLEAGSQHTQAPGAFCLTSVLLARGPDVLLGRRERLEVLEEISQRCGLGLAVAASGTYLEVSRAARRVGLQPTFVVGSDKLAQLEDPAFYPDGDEGVAATFSEVDLLVVPRPGFPARRPDIPELDPARVFGDPALSEIRATEVRDRVRKGEDVSFLVPGEVATRLRGYTSAR